MLFISAPDSQLSAVDSLIDSMMLVENGDDDKQNGDDDKQKDIFKVHNIPNPAFQRLFQVLHTSLSGVETPLCLLNLIYQLSFFSKQHKLQVSDDESPTTLVLLISNWHPLVNQTPLSVSTPSGGQPRHSSSSYGGVAEGHSGLPWCHPWKLPGSAGGGETDFSPHRSREEKESEDKRSDIWQRVSLIYFACGPLKVTE